MKLAEAHAKVILFKSKTLADGQHPVMLRITYKRQRRYYSLPDIKGTGEEWNSELGRFATKKHGEENKEINRWESKADNAIKTIRNQDHEFTFDRFEKNFFGSLKNITVQGFIESEIKQMKVDGRFSSMNVAGPLLSRLKEFRPKELKFSDFDYSLLKGFESHLKKTCSTNGVAAYFRTLKALLNKAVKEGYANAEINPFRGFAIQKESTAKRSLTKEQMLAIINCKVDENIRAFHSRNFFVFSYLCRGINFTDLALLKWEKNIKEGRIVYVRSKTKKEGSAHLSIPIRGLIEDIINYYRTHYIGNDFIFPILKPSYNELQRKERIKGRLKKLNRDIRSICSDDLKINATHDITFYSARHTWATVQKKSGTSTEIIQEGLGHGNKIITETYLSQFDNHVLDKADEFIIEPGTILGIAK